MGLRVTKTCDVSVFKNISNYKMRPILKIIYDR